MPIYEYRCPQCRRVTEDFSRHTDIRPTIQCQCGGTATFIMSIVGGIKIGDLVMSVISKGRPDETAEENWYRCAKVAEAKDVLPKFNTSEQRRYDRYIRKKAKAMGW